MTVITLTTDFGEGDHEAGVLKGVIWQIASDVRIADLTHNIAPHDILEATILLWRAVPYFPDGSVHVVVVDPGVGTTRRGIAARFGSQYFVGPDNGLISMLLEKSEANGEITEFVHLDQPHFWMPVVSNVFHGRDIFAPVAAHLVKGIPMKMLGSPITDPIRLEIPKPIRTSQGWMGQVVRIDHFGNLSTNFHAFHISQQKEVMISIHGQKMLGLVSTFGDRRPGELVALIDSSDSLAICIVNGSASQVLQASVGDQVEVIFHG